MPFTVTSLGGASGGIPTGSGLLVDGPAGRLVVDCGNGVVAHLAARKALDVDALVLTHLHADHVQDLYPLALYRRYARKPLVVHAPEGTRDLLARWFPLFSTHPDAMLAALDLREGDAPFEAAGLRVAPFAVEHDAPRARGLAITDGRATCVVSGDTRPCRAVEDAARGADLLLHEATYAGEGKEASRAHHTTAREAGALAKRVGARRLVLVHLLVTTDAEAARSEAEEAYGAPVEVARAGDAWRVG